MTAVGRRGTVVTRTTLAISGIAAVVALAGLVEPIRTTVIGGTGWWTPSPYGAPFDELFFAGMTAIGSGPGVVAIVSAVAISLVVSRRPIAATFVVVAAVGASLLTRLLKVVYQAPRPPTMGQATVLPDAIPPELVIGVVILAVAIGLIRGWGSRSIAFGGIVLCVLLLQRMTDLVPVDPGFDSFPSGHALSGAALATAVAVLAWRGPWRWLVVIAAFVYAAGVGLSRVYLGVHYPVDVIGGWGVGILWTVLVWLELRTSTMWRRERLRSLAAPAARWGD